MSHAHAALAASTYPKLLFSAEPGALVSPAVAEEFARKLTDCRLVKLGSGVHFLQEDHAQTIGRSVAAFIAEVESRAGDLHDEKAMATPASRRDSTARTRSG
jgi:haloalkane dehalogenase